MVYICINAKDKSDTTKRTNTAPQFNILYTETDVELHGYPIPAQYFALMLVCNHCGHVRQFSVDQLAKHLRASAGEATNEE